MASEGETPSGRAPEAGLVTIKVEGLRARVAADLVDKVVERLKQAGCNVVVIEEQQ